MKKRIGALILAFVMVLGLMAPAYAEGPTAHAVSDVFTSSVSYDKTQDWYTVTVSSKLDAALKTLSFTVDYDDLGKDALTVADGSFFKENGTTSSTTSNGVTTYTWTAANTASGLAGNSAAPVKLFTIGFKVKDGAYNGDYKVKLSVSGNFVTETGDSGHTLTTGTLEIPVTVDTAKNDRVSITGLEDVELVYGQALNLNASVINTVDGTLTYEWYELSGSSWGSALSTNSTAGRTVDKGSFKIAGTKLTTDSGNAKDYQYKLVVKSAVTNEDQTTTMYQATKIVKVTVKALDLKDYASAITSSLGNTITYNGDTQSATYTVNLGNGETYTLVSSDANITYYEDAKPTESVSLKDAGHYTIKVAKKASGANVLNTSTDEMLTISSITVNKADITVPDTLNLSKKHATSDNSTSYDGKYSLKELLVEIGLNATDAAAVADAGAVTLAEETTTKTLSVAGTGTNQTITVTGDGVLKVTFDKTKVKTALGDNYNELSQTVYNINIKAESLTTTNDAKLALADAWATTDPVWTVSPDDNTLSRYVKDTTETTSPGAFYQSSDADKQASYTLYNEDGTVAKDADGDEIKDIVGIAALGAKVLPYAGTYTLKVTWTNDYYTSSDELTFTVNPIKLTVTKDAAESATPTTTLTYNEGEQTVTLDNATAWTSAAGYNNMKIVYNSGNKGTNAGEYTANISFVVDTEDNKNNDKNYVIVYDAGYTSYDVKWTLGKSGTVQDVDATVGADPIVIRAESTAAQSVDVDIDAVAATLDSKYANPVFTGAELATNSTGAGFSFSAVPADKDKGITASLKITSDGTKIAAYNNYKIIVKFSCDNYTTVKKTVIVKAVAKDDVKDYIVVNSSATTATYTGAGQDVAQGKATMNKRELTGTITYTYTPKTVSGVTPATNANGLPLDAGTYTVKAIYEDDTHYGESDNFEVTITKADLAVATITLKSREYAENKLDAEIDGVTFTGLVGQDALDANKPVITKDYNSTGTAKYADDKPGADKEATGLTITLSSTGRLYKNYNLTNASDVKATGTVTGNKVSIIALWDGNVVENTGSVVYPTVTVTVKGGNPTKTLTPGEDYEVYSEASAEGEAWAIVKPVATSIYTFDEADVRFEIGPSTDKRVDIADQTVVVSGAVALVAGSGSYDKTGLTASIGGANVAGSFTLNDEAAVLAMTESGTAKATFTVAESNESYKGSKVVDVTVTVTTSGSTTPSTPDTPDTPDEGDTEAVVDNEVTVVLKTNTVKYTGKATKLTVYVYTAAGTKLSSKQFTATPDTDTSVGKHTLTVKLNDSSYTFTDGSDEAEVTYYIVNKTDGLTVTATSKAVNYGSIPEIKVTVKQGSKKVNATVTTGLDELKDADGKIAAGIYTVAVSATYGEETVTTQVLVTVKAEKVTLKSIKLDTLTQAQVKELDKQELEESIKNKIVAASKGLTADDIESVTITNMDAVVSATKTVKVKYTVKLDDSSNKTFTSGKFVHTKDASVSLKVKG